MQDNNLVTHGLHWLTLGQDGWECAHPECGWMWSSIHPQDIAQHLFDADHAKLSEPGVSVQT